MNALTDKEIAALTGAAIGLTGTAVARRYGVASRTIRRAQARAADKIGANGLVHAAVLAAAYGLIDLAHLEAETLPRCDWRARAPRPWRPRRRVEAAR